MTIAEHLMALAAAAKVKFSMVKISILLGGKCLQNGTVYEFEDGSAAIWKKDQWRLRAPDCTASCTGTCTCTQGVTIKVAFVGDECSPDCPHIKVFDGDMELLARTVEADYQPFCRITGVRCEDSVSYCKNAVERSKK